MADLDGEAHRELIASGGKHWQTAMSCLLSAADNGGLIMMARIAVLQARHAD
jgi:hypothetical protein